MTRIDLSRLREPFLPEEIEWRVGRVIEEKARCLALPYITNRAVQNRLDEVCGPENWWNDFKEWGDKGQICGITIHLDDRDITKWDGAENTAVEPIKGGLSNSMKRAAAEWGIGRYLYDLPVFYADCKKKGKNWYIVEPPQLPKEALPKGFKGKQEFATGDKYDENEQTLEDFLNNMPNENQKISEQDAQILEDVLIDYESKGLLKVDSVLQYFKVRSVYDMTEKMRATCYKVLNQKDKAEENKKAAKK